MRRMALVLALLALLAADASSQEKRLSEVAGGIRLRSVDGESNLVDLAPEVRTTSQPVVDGIDLLELSEVFAAGADEVDALLDEIRNNENFYDDGWRTRMLDACSRLSTASRTLLAVDAQPRYSEGFVLITDAAVEGAEVADLLE